MNCMGLRAPVLRSRSEKSKVVVHCDRLHLLTSLFPNRRGSVGPRRGLPIVFPFSLWNPGWQSLIQIRRQRVNVRLVTAANGNELLPCLRRVAQDQTLLG